MNLATESTRAALPIIRLHLTARAEQPLQLPPYAGSMLRGAFGHALLALAPLPHVDGKPCALHASCPYCQLFAAPPLPEHSLQKFSQMPQPYVVEPPAIGERSVRAEQTFEFALVLIGKALALAPVAVQAMERALRIGLGDAHSRCTLVQVRDEQGAPWIKVGSAGAAWAGEAPTTGLPPPPVLGERATLNFLTPLRLQVQGKVARGGQLRARDLLVALARRHQLLLDVHLGRAAPQHDFAALIAQAAAVELMEHDMRWFDCGRFSQRQRQEIKLSGLVGRVELRGALAPFAELLHLGQWLHVGKTASFGLGRYALTASQRYSP